MTTTNFPNGVQGPLFDENGDPVHGGGAAAVTSVNGQTGDVSLVAAFVDGSTGTVADVTAALIAAGLMASS